MQRDWGVCRPQGRLRLQAGPPLAEGEGEARLGPEGRASPQPRLIQVPGGKVGSCPPSVCRVLRGLQTGLFWAGDLPTPGS